MKLSRNEMVQAVVGGVFAVLALMLGWFMFSLWNEKSEAVSDAEDALATIDSIRSADVFPSEAAILAVVSNRNEIAEWREVAKVLAGRGDRKFTATSPAMFKQRLQDAVRELGSYPGSVDGKIANAKFLFGFEAYLGENGRLPEETELPKLQRQLDLITALVEHAADCGVSEVRSIKRDERPMATIIEAANAAANGGNAKKGGKAAKKTDDAPKVLALEYGIQLLVRPPALVKYLNHLTAEDRFIVVKDMSFKVTDDKIVVKLNEREQATQATAQAGNRRSRRGSRTEEAGLGAKQEEKKVDRLVIDPEIDAPILIDLTLAVWDFDTGVAQQSVPQSAPQTQTEEGK